MATSTSHGPSGPRTFSLVVLVLTAALAATMTTAVIMTVLYLGVYQQPPSGASANGGATPVAAPPPAGPAEPYAQTDTMELHGRTTGRVHYAVPYLLTPHLAVEPGDRYVVIEEYETGFLWADRENYSGGSTNAIGQALKAFRQATEEGNDDAASAEPAGPRPQPPLMWTAKGIRAGSADAGLYPRTLTGKFATAMGAEGMVAFGRTFATPPRVDIDSKYVTATEIQTTYFRWKNVATTSTFSSGSVDWEAPDRRGASAKQRVARMIRRRRSDDAG